MEKGTTRPPVHIQPIFHPFGSHHFEIPFDTRGKKWVRITAWDAAYQGAILQPQRLGPMPSK